MILEIIFLAILSGLTTLLIAFLIRQRSQLLKLQEQLTQEKATEKSEEQNAQDSSMKMSEIEGIRHSSQDEFAENLKIIKDLQSKLDGLTIEMKIRGEMIVERDNKIDELQKRIYDLDAQVSIFKEQIAPALEQTITNLRDRASKLKSTIDEQKKALQLKDERINASQNVLKKAGMGEILKLEDFQISLDKKDSLLKRQEIHIKKLQEQVEHLPVICVRMTEEIQERESDIHSLKVYNKVLNKKLLEVQKELNQKSNESDTTITDLSKKLIELQDELEKEKTKLANQDREMLILNSMIMEKESKISALETKIHNLLFK